MAEQADQEDRTEAATPKRLEKAREEGRAPVSRELAAAAGLGAAVLALMLAAPSSSRTLAVQLRRPLSDLTLPAGEALRDVAWAGLAAAAPLLGAVAVAAVAAVLLQTGGMVNGAGLKPKPSRLNPLAGLKRLFGPDNAIEALKSLVKLGLLGWVTWWALSGMVPDLGASLAWTPGTLLDRGMRDVLHLMVLLLGGQVAIAALDVAWTRFRFARQLRMSREEIKQEHRESEGDPHVKGRQKQLRMARTRKRMMAAVPKATVVITNPTHYAVALAYERGTQAAPRVVAKGVDAMAARIRDVAQENRVPLVANPPLARVLYRVEVDAEIPAEHFQAVAEIIAYVWRLRGQARRG